MSFTDDAGNAGSLTSAAPDAVAPAPEPLTASFSGVPAKHGGQGETFTFELAFSENLELSYKTPRDEALQATGGTVRRAKRQDSGSNQRWTIHVEPTSHGRVTVRLPAGSVETADGHELSNSPSASVAGPVGISVADARVEEGENAVLAFSVTLSRAASRTVTVDYATSDGSAQSGSDYTATSGTLTFQTGDASETIEVAVHDDLHDEGEETLTLRLSNVSGGRLTDDEATGTIENHDPLPRALLARFGRTAAVHVVEHVEERLHLASRGSGAGSPAAISGGGWSGTWRSTSSASSAADPAGIRSAEPWEPRKQERSAAAHRSPARRCQAAEGRGQQRRAERSPERWALPDSGVPRHRRARQHLAGASSTAPACCGWASAAATCWLAPSSRSTARAAAASSRSGAAERGRTSPGARERSA